MSPQYNWGYPAALKNAIDHCYNEWRAKPLLIVTYGGHAGNKCAAQLLQVAEALKMRPTPTMPGITLTSDMIHGGPINPAADFADTLPAVRQGWAELKGLLAGA